jgi:hypothetical protein
MRLAQVVPTVALTLLLSGAGVAQTHQEESKDAQAQLKQDEKADRAQAKADKQERKALKSKKVKKAVKAQDKADKEAVKAAELPK